MEDGEAEGPAVAGQRAGRVILGARPEMHGTSASHGSRTADPAGRAAAIATLEQAPKGALLVAGIAVTLLLLSWLAFYFGLFLPRGPIQ